MKTTRLMTCNNSFEAEVIKGKLAAEGIPSVLQGENISVLYGGLSPFSVNILVNEEDLEKAQTILNDKQ